MHNFRYPACACSLSLAVKHSFSRELCHHRLCAYQGMPPPTTSSFYAQIWQYVEPKVNALKTKKPGGKTPMEWEKICKKAKADIDKDGEARNVIFNLVHLSDPGQAAIPEDVLEISKVKKSAKFYFWDQKANRPKAPSVWPRGKNVPVVVYSSDINKLGPFQHYGHCSIVAAFFWAYAQALQNPAWSDEVAGFESLCINALADYKLVRSESEVNILAFNAVEENEESRENDGFTGARKILLVTFGVKNVIKEKKGQKWKYDDVSTWLRTHIKFHDEKAVPSANVCKDLHSLANDFVKNHRAFAAYQEAETLWGRSTLFDEYSKLLIMCQKSRNPEDLAFIAEWLLAEMKTTPPPRVPDNPSQGKLKDVGGPICLAQVARDAVTCLLKKNLPPTWAPFAALLEQFGQPSRFLELFPPGGQTPEASVKLLAGCPSSIKQVANILKGVLDGSSSSPWNEKIKGYISKTRLWRIPEERLMEMFEVFAEDWTEFQDTIHIESGKVPPERKAEPKEGAASSQQGKEGEAAGQTAAHTEEKPKDKRSEVLELAKQKANGIYTDPGVVILTPDRWERAALESMMKAQLIFADQGAFCGFFFAGSDREARVHPNQNKCLREAPLSKVRLTHFCHALDSIMVECRDAVVIGVGRGLGNAAVVREVVEEMKWEHKSIDVITARDAYDDFIKSGTPGKRRRIHRGIATCKYKSQYWICWKPSREGRSQLSIKNGLRVYVDKGSRIAADIMMDCPQVRLDEIYEVSKEVKAKALGEGGFETQQEARTADKDFSQPT